MPRAPDHERPPAALRSAPAGFSRRTSADEERLLALRVDLGAWIGDLGLGRHQTEDIVLAAFEAMANAVEHAYRGGSGDVEVSAALAGDVLTVTVTDWGSWKPNGGADPARGRGLVLLRGLAHHAELVRRDDGTTVRMAWTVEADPA